MPAILGANSVSGYEISNSLRFNDNDSPTLDKNFSSDGDRQKFTWSAWIKRGNLGVDMVPLGAAEGSGRDEIRLNSNNKFQVFFGDASDASLITTRVFRDVSAWYHFVVAVDTTQGTAANRIKVYVNGVQESVFDTANYPDQNYQMDFTADCEHNIGAIGAGTSLPFDGYMADMNFVDGTQLTPSNFGKTDDNGVWIPIKPSGVTYGTNGFFLEFKQTGTSANASGIGADTSGNGHHMTLTNLAALDVTTDTPNNNFAVMNINNSGTNAVYSEGNLRLANSSNHNTVFPTIMPTTGKWYFEGNMTSHAAAGGLGFRTDGNRHESAYAEEANKYFLYLNNSSAYIVSQTSNVDIGANLNSNSHTFQVAIDFDTAKYYFGRNDTWYAADGGSDGNPATGANPTYDLADGTAIFPFITTGGLSWAINFGQPTVAVSSGNADADGHGNFEFAPPSGFFAYCTKNLAEYG